MLVVRACSAPAISHNHGLPLGPLRHPGVAWPGDAQRDAARADGLAWHGRRHPRPLPVRLSVLVPVFRHGHVRCPRERCLAVADVLALACGRHHDANPRDRIDAGGDERPFVRGDDGVPEDRGDPDRDLRFCLSRRSSDVAESGRDHDRDGRRWVGRLEQAQDLGLDALGRQGRQQARERAAGREAGRIGRAAPMRISSRTSSCSPPSSWSPRSPARRTR